MWNTCGRGPAGKRAPLTDYTHMEPDAAAAHMPTTPATPIPAAPTVTLTVAAEVQRCDMLEVDGRRAAEGSGD